MTQNGARFLAREAEVGTVAVGKRAGVLIKGDPAAHVLGHRERRASGKQRGLKPETAARRGDVKETSVSVDS